MLFDHFYSSVSTVLIFFLICTGLPAQPSNSNFSATIEMDDSDDNVFATALANVNLKAAKNKEKTLAMKKLQLLSNRFVLYWWGP